MGGAWTVCTFKGERLVGKREGAVFEGGGVDTPMHNMSHVIQVKFFGLKVYFQDLKKNLMAPFYGWG